MDRSRMAPLKSATSAAIVSISQEAAGWKERVDDLGYKLASALEDVDGIYFVREPDEEKQLTILEDRFLEAQRRSKDLNRQLAVLHEIDKLLDDV